MTDLYTISADRFRKIEKDLFDLRQENAVLKMKIKSQEKEIEGLYHLTAKQDRIIEALI